MFNRSGGYHNVDF